MHVVNEEVVNRYLDLVPIEIREAVNALSNDQRWAVYIALTTEGHKYFTELKDQFGANPNVLTPILKALVEGGLVARRVRAEDVGDRRKIFYEPTAMGAHLLAALYEGALPPYRPRQERTLDTTDRAHDFPGDLSLADQENALRKDYSAYDAV